MGRDPHRWSCWLWLAIITMCACAPGVPQDAPAINQITDNATADGSLNNGTNSSQNDAVTVISLENMDTLLRLRLDADQLSTAVAAASGRTRRGVTSLCDRSECRCNKKQWFNVSCYFRSHEELELNSGSLPSELLELRLDNLANLKINKGTFGNTTAFNKLVLSRIKELHIQTGAFSNIRAASFSLEIEDCEKSVLENSSFLGMHGTVDARISTCDQLTIGKSAFSRLRALTIENVPSLVLKENTFSADPTKSAKIVYNQTKNPSTTIDFHNVAIDIIPKGTVRSSVRKIVFRNSTIGNISSGAFSAPEISHVILEDTKLKRLESGAFSDGTLIHLLELNNVQVALVEPGVLTAVSNLSIRQCRINELREGAFNITASTIHLTDNIFSKIYPRAFQVHQWNNVTIDRNAFDQLPSDVFSFPFTIIPKIDNYYFSFTYNDIGKVDGTGLGFIPLNDAVALSFWGNIFRTPCSCALKKMTEDLAGSPDLAQRLLETSLCSIEDWTANCFKIVAGAYPMANFTSQICNETHSNEIICENPSRSFYPSEQADWSLLLDSEKRMLTIIFITVTTCVSFIILIVIAKWVQRKGLFGRIISQFFQTSSLVTTASISRINIHEYAEIQNLQNQTQIVEESDEEELIAVDDKATQTLPEELTQDLLQSLREKLDDPDNYREARDMIEHLYDLIKVEESCNNRTSTVLDEDTLYAELQPRTRPRTRNREVCSVGTRSPSLDRLAPVHYLPRPAVVNDYAEPRDRQVSSHVYCELPGGVPDVLVSSNLLANRPLPDAPGSSGL